MPLGTIVRGPARGRAHGPGARASGRRTGRDGPAGRRGGDRLGRGPGAVGRLAFWRLLPLTTPAGAAGEARRAEDEGWTGVGLPDTQSKLPDPYVEMTVAGLATTGLQVATAVTHPFTPPAPTTPAPLLPVPPPTSR